MAGRRERMTEILSKNFSPLKLEVIDESHKHAAHGKDHPDHAYDNQGETHFKVIMVSDLFKGKSRLDRQRAVHVAMEGEFKSGLHALTMKLKSSDEE